MDAFMKNAAALAWMVIGLFGLVYPAQAEELETPVSLSADRYLSIETGSDITGGVSTLLGETEAQALRRIDLPPAFGIPIRAARTILLDAPLAEWLAVADHELFGHGGRAREFGSSAHVHLGSPWGGRDSSTSFDADGLMKEDLLRVYAGGVEANAWAATALEREAVSGRPMRSFELLFLTASRFVASDYVLRSTPDPRREPGRFYSEYSGGGDVANYLGYLNARFNGGAGITLASSPAPVISAWRRMRRQAYWNALDPGAWLSLWEVGRSVVRGGDPRAVPLPLIGGRRVLPVLSTDWMSDGTTASLEWILGPAKGTGVDGDSPANRKSEDRLGTDGEDRQSPGSGEVGLAKDTGVEGPPQRGGRARSTCR